MRHDELKRRVIAEIDAKAEHLIAVGEGILRDPELGFKETRTAGIVGASSSGWGSATSKTSPSPG